MEEATAIAVAGCNIAGPGHVLQAGKACRAGSPARKEFRMAAQPAVQTALVQWVRLALCVQPPLVNQRNDTGNVADTPQASSHPPSNQTFRGEQRHLSVIGNRAKFAKAMGVFLDSARAKYLKDLGSGQKLYRRSKCVANCASHQAASVQVLNVLRLRPVPWSYGHTSQLSFTKIMVVRSVAINTGHGRYLHQTVGVVARVLKYVQ